MDFDDVADELYGLRPEDFTSARGKAADAAKQAGDRPLADEIRGLRQPTVSAWAANLLVREHPGEVKPLLDIGQRCSPITQ